MWWYGRSRKENDQARERAAVEGRHRRRHRPGLSRSPARVQGGTGAGAERGADEGLAVRQAGRQGRRPRRAAQAVQEVKGSSDPRRDVVVMIASFRFE